MRYTETHDDSAVSPVIGVILMVAITVILAAVIGTFVLGLGDQVQETPSAGISVSQDPGTVGITLVDPGNVEGLQLIGPDGTKSTQVMTGQALESGVSVTLRSNGAVETFLNDPDNTITILGSTGGGFTQGTFVDVADLKGAITSSPGGPTGNELQDTATPTLGEYNATTAYAACLFTHSGFEVGGQRVPSNVSIPCHTPILAQSDAVTAGTSNEATVSGTQVTVTQPLLLRSGDYQLLGIVGGEDGVIQSFSVDDDVSQE